MFDIDLKKHPRLKKKMGDRDPGPSDGGERQTATFRDSVRWAAEADQEKENTVNTSYTFWIILGAILVIVLVMVVIFMYMSGSSEQADANSALDEMQDPSNSINAESSRYYDERYSDDREYPYRSDDYYDDDRYYSSRNESPRLDYRRESRPNQRSIGFRPKSSGGTQDSSEVPISEPRHDYQRDSRGYRSSRSESYINSHQELGSQSSDQRGLSRSRADDRSRGDHRLTGSLPAASSPEVLRQGVPVKRELQVGDTSREPVRQTSQDGIRSTKFGLQPRVPSSRELSGKAEFVGRSPRSGDRSNTGSSRSRRDGFRPEESAHRNPTDSSSTRRTSLARPTSRNSTQDNRSSENSTVFAQQRPSASSHKGQVSRGDSRTAVLHRHSASKNLEGFQGRSAPSNISRGGSNEAGAQTKPAQSVRYTDHT